MTSLVQQTSTARQKICFVTVGATVSFNSLVRAVISSPFLRALLAAGYTHLRVQYGRTGQRAFDEALTIVKSESSASVLSKLDIHGVDLILSSNEMDQELSMLLGRNGREEGMIISHAGTGSIMSGLMGGMPLVVVPNTDLADNHQEEIADAFAEKKWVLRGHLDDLVPVVEKAEVWRREMSKPLRNQWQGDQKSKDTTSVAKTLHDTTIHDIMDQELGYDNKGFQQWKIHR